MKDKNIELIVCDNASTDATQTVMSRICERNKILYYRNTSNVGPDRNFLYGYERASGRYVMLLGDDDYLLDGAIDTILESLNKNPIMTFLNFSSLKERKCAIHYGKPVFKEEGILSYQNKEEFFEKINIFITFMSSMILKTDVVRRIRTKESYIGTYFIQAYIALDVMKEKGLYLVNTYNCLAASPNTILGYDLYNVWGEQYFKLLYMKAVDIGISKAVIDRVYYVTLDSIIYDFVLAFRIRQDTSGWNKALMLDHVRMFDDLYKKYYRAMNMPLLYVILIKALRML